MIAKDKKIIEDNPNATPHELLTKYGLSDKGFDELVAEADAKALAVSKASKPKLIPSAILQPLQPDTTQYLSQAEAGKVRIIPKSGGMGTEVSASVAAKMLAKNPKLYKIG